MLKVRMAVMAGAAFAAGILLTLAFRHEPSTKKKVARELIMPLMLTKDDAVDPHILHCVRLFVQAYEAAPKETSQLIHGWKPDWYGPVNNHVIPISLKPAP